MVICSKCKCKIGLLSNHGSDSNPLCFDCSNIANIKFMEVNNNNDTNELNDHPVVTDLNVQKNKKLTVGLIYFFSVFVGILLLISFIISIVPQNNHTVKYNGIGLTINDIKNANFNSDNFVIKLFKQKPNIVVNETGQIQLEYIDKLKGYGCLVTAESEDTDIKLIVPPIIDLSNTFNASMSLIFLTSLVEFINKNNNSKQITEWVKNASQGDIINIGRVNLKMVIKDDYNIGVWIY